MLVLEIFSLSSSVSDDPLSGLEISSLYLVSSSSLGSIAGLFLLLAVAVRVAFFRVILAFPITRVRRRLLRGVADARVDIEVRSSVL